MSTELNLPSYIYQENIYTPAVINQLNLLDTPKKEIVIDQELYSKINICLENQIKILATLDKIQQKLEEFQ